eukprot:5813543-Karenia_brevis.AAC.1
MRKAQDEREENNDRIVAALQKCADFWKLFGGPLLEELRSPTAVILEDAHKAIAAQRRWLQLRASVGAQDGGLSPQEVEEYGKMI